MPSRGGKGGGRGGGGQKNDRETIISKNLSYVLRHGAKDLGLHIDEKGFVGVAELLAHQRFRSLKTNLPELQDIVSSNAKQRFELAPVPPTDGNTIADSGLDKPASWLIRATQGHSIKGLDSESLLTPILPTDADFPAEVVHGTYPAAWKLVLDSGGLKTMTRTHVHFAIGLPGGGLKATDKQSFVTTPTAESHADGSESKADDAVKPTPDAAPVVSGMRASASILIWVDLQRSSDGGVKWWKSKNGVVLTEGVAREGSKEGLVPLEYVSRVVERKTGNVIWKNDWWQDSQS